MSCPLSLGWCVPTHPATNGAGMTILTDAPSTVATSVTGGVDTHKDVHVAAALDRNGAELGVARFPTTPAGYRRLLAWLEGFGTVERVGVEGTGTWGAGLARF